MKDNHIKKAHIQAHNVCQVSKTKSPGFAHNYTSFSDWTGYEKLLDVTVFLQKEDVCLCFIFTQCGMPQQDSGTFLKV